MSKTFFCNFNYVKTIALKCYESREFNIIIANSELYYYLFSLVLTPRNECFGNTEIFSQ